MWHVHIICDLRIQQILHWNEPEAGPWNPDAFTWRVAAKELKLTFRLSTVFSFITSNIWNLLFSFLEECLATVIYLWSFSNITGFVVCYFFLFYWQLFLMSQCILEKYQCTVVGQTNKKMLSGKTLWRLQGPENLLLAYIFFYIYPAEMGLSPFCQLLWHNYTLMSEALCMSHILRKIHKVLGYVYILLFNILRSAWIILTLCFCCCFL